MIESEDESESMNLFEEPKDFYTADKPATITTYTTNQGLTVPLRLVGQSPLWGHLLWNAGKVIAGYLEDHANELIKDKTVLELGAGAGLPSLICALHGAKKVLVTDYPDPDLVENLQYNIKHSLTLDNQISITVQGYLWGNDIQPLLQSIGSQGGFDLLILADILFNHSEHEKLISTLQQTLKKDQDSRALVFFTPYRPWLFEKDLNFFELATQAGFVVNKLFEHIMDKLMFPEDRGDEILRRTVFAYEVTWPK